MAKVKGRRGPAVTSLSDEDAIDDSDLDLAAGGAGGQQAATTKKGTDVIDHALQALGHEITSGDVGHNFRTTLPGAASPQAPHSATWGQIGEGIRDHVNPVPGSHPAPAPEAGTHHGPVIGEHRAPPASGEPSPQSAASHSGHAGSAAETGAEHGARQGGGGDWAQAKGYNHLTSLLTQPTVDTSGFMSSDHGKTHHAPQVVDTHSSHSGAISTTETATAGGYVEHGHLSAGAGGEASFNQVTHIGNNITIEDGASAGGQAHIGPMGASVAGAAEAHETIHLTPYVAIEETASGAVSAHIGPFGAAASAQAGAGMEVHGPAGLYAGEHATAGAGAHIGLGAGNIGLGAEAGAQISEHAGIQNSIGLGHHTSVSGGVNVEASLSARAAAEATIGKGGVNFGESTVAGDYVAATANYGVESHGFGVHNTIGVIAPGSVGEGINVGAHLHEGTLSLTLGGTADIGIAGITGSTTIDLNLKPAIEVAHFIGEHQPHQITDAELAVGGAALHSAGAAIGGAMQVGNAVASGAVHLGTDLVDGLKHHENIGQIAVTVGHDIAHTGVAVGNAVASTAITIGHTVEGAAISVAHDAASLANAAIHTAPVQDGIQMATTLGHGIAQGATTLASDLQHHQSLGTITSDLGHIGIGTAVNLGHEVQHAAGQAAGVAQHVGITVLHGLENAGHSVATSIVSSATNDIHKVTTTATTAIHGIESVASTVGHGLENAGHKVESGLKSAGESVAHALTHW